MRSGVGTRRRATALIVPVQRGAKLGQIGVDLVALAAEFVLLPREVAFERPLLQEGAVHSFEVRSVDRFGACDKRLSNSAMDASSVARRSRRVSTAATTAPRDSPSLPICCCADVVKGAGATPPSPNVAAKAALADSRYRPANSTRPTRSRSAFRTAPRSSLICRMFSSSASNDASCGRASTRPAIWRRPRRAGHD